MIRSKTIQYRNDDDLNGLPAEILNHPRDRMLIQVFSGELDDEKIRRTVDRLGSMFPGATVLGTTTAGEIAKGQSLELSVVISITSVNRLVSDICPTSKSITASGSTSSRERIARRPGLGWSNGPPGSRGTSPRLTASCRCCA